jgi:hypothetical protein
MMAALDSGLFPSMLLQEPGKILTGNAFHTAISRTLSCPFICTSVISTDIQASMAS